MTFLEAAQYVTREAVSHREPAFDGDLCCARLLETLSDEWLTALDLANLVMASKSNVQRILGRMFDENKFVDRRTVKRDRGSPTHQYRRRQPGQISPLYESSQDAEELAQCWGGMTFVGQPGAVPCHA